MLKKLGIVFFLVLVSVCFSTSVATAASPQANVIYGAEFFNIDDIRGDSGIVFRDGFAVESLDNRFPSQSITVIDEIPIPFPWCPPMPWPRPFPFPPFPPIPPRPCPCPRCNLIASYEQQFLGDNYWLDIDQSMGNLPRQFLSGAEVVFGLNFVDVNISNFRPNRF